ncbi:hypothetical protein ACJ2A9_12595 [Anaerobacillus sp. MEB173]|uniref:hypothetical protein n=1 Tax=Anaerobacillus sp. MEB173 TaxID=3383345 RepID=UPI003F91CD86
MDILNLIEEHYRLTELKWRKNKEIIESKTGVKKIRYWENRQLLDWHIAWRDGINHSNQVMVDRMIRTKKGEPAIQYENGWLTLHDEVSITYPIEEDIDKWALLLSQMLGYGLTVEKTIHEDVPFSIEQCLRLLPHSKKLDGVAKVVLEKSCNEAKKRVQLVKGLLKHCDKQKLPIVDKITTVQQGKQIYQLLFWVGGNEKPDVGYKGIRKFLEQWLTVHGTDGTELLLNKINDNFSLTGEQGLFLLAECLTPWELHECLDHLAVTTNSEEVYTIFDRYNQRWELSRELVDIISSWLDKKREKVAT